MDVIIGVLFIVFPLAYLSGELFLGLIKYISKDIEMYNRNKVKRQLEYENYQKKIEQTRFQNMTTKPQVNGNPEWMHIGRGKYVRRPQPTIYHVEQQLTINHNNIVNYNNTTASLKANEKIVTCEYCSAQYKQSEISSKCLSCGAIINFIS